MKDVLIIEDRPDSQELMRFALEKAGFKTRVAGNGEEGLQAIYQKKPELLILDLMLPDMSGLQILEKVRKDKSNKSIKIIVLTAAKLDEKESDAFLKLGAQKFLHKPIEMEKLRDELNKL